MYNNLISILRNKFLADKLFLIRYIEERGRGTNRIIDEMRENGLLEPELKNYSGGFAVILYGLGKSFEVNERQKKAIEYLKTNDIISTKIYIRLNKVSDKTAFLELKDLLIKNILMKEGKGRATIYKLKM